MPLGTVTAAGAAMVAVGGAAAFAARQRVAAAGPDPDGNALDPPEEADTPEH